MCNSQQVRIGFIRAGRLIAMVEKIRHMRVLADIS